ncbi:MAG: molecular chaperone TorD family protein [Thermodesulfovibrionales bacterium]|jgi:nitrate reductase assembly molybdenum cofactor insertion protein NarJ|nr:molecular chaperone TorD family protein [Thermodesulfovibrionales bacterium]
MNPFRYFSLVFSYPTEEMLEEIEELSADFPGMRCSEILRGMPIEDVKAEYTRLFISAFPALLCPPYESFYREGVVYGNTSAEVCEIYKSHGFDYVYEGEPPDLLSVELDFLSMTNDGDFLDRLKEWIFDFTERVKRHSSLYGILAEELENFIKGV